MNKTACLLLALFLCGAASSPAEDITLNNGTVYKDATILKHDAVTATILFSDGGAAVPISDLSPDLQKRLNYDPAQAQKQLALDAQNEARQKALAAQTKLLDGAALKVWGEVVQVQPNGFFADFKTIDRYGPEVAQTQTRVVETLPAGLGRGDVVQTTITGYHHARITLGKIFVSCNSTGLVDQQHWSGIVWNVGTYAYIDEKGNRATIPRYSTSPDEAYRALTQGPVALSANL